MPTEYENPFRIEESGTERAASPFREPASESVSETDSGLVFESLSGVLPTSVSEYLTEQVSEQLPEHLLGDVPANFLEPLFVPSREVSSPASPTDSPVSSLEPLADSAPSLRETGVESFSAGITEQSAALLRQFADWLRSVESNDPESTEGIEEENLREENLRKEYPSEENGVEKEPGVGLYQIFEILAAQRQELKLYTKSGRQTQELIAQTQELIADNQERLVKSIEETSAAVAALERFRREKPDLERKAMKPLLMSIIEIDEAIQRTGAVVDSLRKQLADTFRSSLEHSVAKYCDSLPRWGRSGKRNTIQDFVERLAKERDDEIGRTLEPFRTGFDMLRRRIDEVLKKHSIRRIVPQGEPVDPETMQVVAVVASGEIPPGTVVEVVRFGYLWKDVPLRFADVHASKKK